MSHRNSREDSRANPGGEGHSTCDSPSQRRSHSIACIALNTATPSQRRPSRVSPAIYHINDDNKILTSSPTMIPVPPQRLSNQSVTA